MKDFMTKKLFLAMALILLLGIAASGCMNTADNDGNINRGGIDPVEPAPTADFMPQGISQDAAQTQQAQPAPAAAYDWTRNASQVEGRINQISEVSESRAVVTGNTALVGVKFNSAYQGEMTERIREMIAAEIMAADPSIETVAVTADADDVKAIYELSDRVLAGEKMDALKEDINEIVRNATTLR